MQCCLPRHRESDWRKQSHRWPGPVRGGVCATFHIEEASDSSSACSRGSLRPTIFRGARVSRKPWAVDFAAAGGLENLRKSSLSSDNTTAEIVTARANPPRSLSGIGSLEERINNLRAIPGL